MLRALTCSLAIALSTAACSQAQEKSAKADIQGLYTAIEVMESPYSVDETLDRVTAIVEANGARVFARINHAAGAQSIGTR